MAFEDPKPKPKVIARWPFGKWVSIGDLQRYMAYTHRFISAEDINKSKFEAGTPDFRQEQLDDLRVLHVPLHRNVRQARTFNFVALPREIQEVIITYAGITEDMTIVVLPRFLHVVKHDLDWNDRNIVLKETFLKYYQHMDRNKSSKVIEARMSRGDFWTGAAHWRSKTITLGMLIFKKCHSKLAGWPWRHLSEDQFARNPLYDLRLPLDNIRSLVLSPDIAPEDPLRYTVPVVREFRALRSLRFHMAGAFYSAAPVNVPAPARLIGVLNRLGAFHADIPCKENGDKAVVVTIDHRHDPGETDLYDWIFDDMIIQISNIMELPPPSEQVGII